MTRKSLTRRLAMAGALLVAVSSPAAAHVGAGEAHDFIHGFAHPLGGIDHVLAMVAVGMLAAGLAGRALWLVPATFLVMMSGGGVLGMTLAGVPYVEMAIAASVIVLGGAVALGLSLSTIAAMAIAGFFAVFHGYAHGAEMPLGASGIEFAAGFLMATALLHATGIGLTFAVARIGKAASPRFSAAGGLAMSLAGAGLLAGWL